MQGDAQVNMETDVYSRILDDDRRENAELFEEAFFRCLRMLFEFLE